MWRALGLVSQVGFSMAIPIVLGILGGVWVDSRLSMPPLGALLGTVLGVIVGSILVYRQVARVMVEADREAEYAFRHKRIKKYVDDDEEDLSGDEEPE